MRYITIIMINLFVLSCNIEKHNFPFTEEEMLQNDMYGTLLEYALFDTIKTDFVDSVLCDTILKNKNLIFSKVVTEIGDSSYFFFQMHEYEPIINDYIGILYVDINNFDSIYMYCFDNSFRYSTDEFNNVIEEIAKHNRSSVEATIKHRKINNGYIPHFYFVVMIDYSKSKNGFAKNIIKINNQIDALMETCSKTIFKNDEIKIIPYIEITNRFTEIYQLRHNYYPLPQISEEEILNEIDH